MYSCSNCGNSSTTKLWRCPNCGEFGTFLLDKTLDRLGSKAKSKWHSVNEGSVLETKQNQQTSVFFGIENKELQRVLQKGIKKWWMYLLGWEPGIGKSTLILQILQEIIWNNELNIWYFTWEETPNQIADRRDRLTEKKVEKKFELFHSTHLEDIITTTKEKQFDMIILDSIQTIYTESNESPAGSPNQVKYCSEKLSEFCKWNNITVFIIGHVTKWGEIAGPKYLEHIVDVVLYLEWDRFGQLRFLRCKKNRFWHTDDSGIFEMTLFGLQPVYDLKERILQTANTSIPGSVLTIWLDSWRPVLVNIEVLLNKTKEKYPQKNCIWVDRKRVEMVIAILERYLKLNLSWFDIFINIPGEFILNDSGLDLAIAAGIYWQYHNIVSDKNNIFLGELGLWWQVVKTKLHDKRIRELPDGFNLTDLSEIKNIVEIKRIFS